jgi:hypothetical protein
MKFMNSYLFFWDSFALMDPDPDCESGYGSRGLIDSGSKSLPLICLIF